MGGVSSLARQVFKPTPKPAPAPTPLQLHLKYHKLQQLQWMVMIQERLKLEVDQLQS